MDSDIARKAVGWDSLDDVPFDDVLFETCNERLIALASDVCRVLSIGSQR